MKRLVNLLQPVVVKAVLASMVEHRIDVTGGVDATVAGYLESEAFDLVLIEIARASNQVKYAIVVGTTAGAADNQEVPLRPKAKLRFKNVGENNAASIGLIAVFLSSGVITWGRVSAGSVASTIGRSATALSTSSVCASAAEAADISRIATINR